MKRTSFFAAVVVAAIGCTFAATLVSGGWWPAAGVLLALTALGVWDVLQRRHSVLRNYPLVGHLRFLLEKLRPEMQQYFIERNFDGRPFDRNVRSIVYERAKGTDAEEPFGTERDVEAPGSRAAPGRPAPGLGRGLGGGRPGPLHCLKAPARPQLSVPEGAGSRRRPASRRERHRRSRRGVPRQSLRTPGVPACAMAGRRTTP